MINRTRNVSELYKTIAMVIIWICVIVLLIVLSGCDILQTESEFSEVNLQQTSVALDLRATHISLQATQLSQQYNETIYATRLAQDVQASLEARMQTPVVVSVTPQRPNPGSITTEVPPSPPAIEVTSPLKATPPPDIFTEENIKTAKILLFEDMAGQSSSRYIKDALDAADYHFTDVGSAQGWLKNNILSNQKWDLIIVASEARTKIQGEFFDILLREIHSGVAVIIEIWNGDVLSKGKLSNLLVECGVDVHGNWYNPNKRDIYWLVPNHPIFHQPNEVPLVKTNYFWADDIGDFLRLIPQGDAVLLAGSIEGQTDNHGLLTTCFDGRMIIQSFSDHDYDRSDMMRLWQNYVYYTLKNHFLYHQG